MTARFELDSSVCVAQYDKLKACCDSVSYSSKTNPLVTPILEEKTDSLFSVHNRKELARVSDKSRVLYFGLAWTQEDVQQLYDIGVRTFVIDTVPDYDILLASLTEPVTVFLRMKLKERSIRSERYYVFGMDTKDVFDLIDKNTLHTMGIHVHRKTQNVNEWNLVDDISEVIPESILKKIAFINIGGGIPSEYTNTRLTTVSGVLTKIKLFHEWANKLDIKVITEPGRYICAPAAKLITKIVRITGSTLIVDASVYNAYTDSVFGSQRLKVQGELETGTPYLIKGITPDSIDIFRYRVYLDDPKEGDELVFLNAGAYNFPTDFCDLEKVETIIK
ncbi:MAG: ornithine decarboxylase [Candidatus Woesearchaeota archaeon]|jgi:ornithine decarboxylase